MNEENCALKLVDEIILYYDARSRKYQRVIVCVDSLLNTYWLLPQLIPTNKFPLCFLVWRTDKKLRYYHNYVKGNEVLILNCLKNKSDIFLFGFLLKKIRNNFNKPFSKFWPWFKEKIVCQFTDHAARHEYWLNCLDPSTYLRHVGRIRFWGSVGMEIMSSFEVFQSILITTL